MAQFFQIHPKDPQARLIRRTVDIVRDGGIIVYPTDSSYALGCRMDNKEGLERIRRIRRLEEDHNFTLVCIDISQVSTFARITNESFRLIKSLTPGPFTFILEATKEVPRRLSHPQRKTIDNIQPGGILVQASCSNRVTEEQFFGRVRDAARSAGRTLELLARTGHAVDHPATFSDGSYLKCLFARA